MMTATRKLMLGLSIAALSIGGFAYAQASADHHGIDADGNGAITRAEAQTAVSAMFAKRDANKDGKLDKADRAAGREDMRGRIFARLDTNKDGAVSRAEFMAARGPDGDGPAGDGPGRHGMRGHRGGMMMMARMADADKDGAISQAEATAAAMKHFDMVDANHDGQITGEEREAAHARMKAAK